MAETIGHYILMGLFIGVGGAISEWLKEKFIKPKLEDVHDKFTRVFR